VSFAHRHGMHTTYLARSLAQPYEVCLGDSISTHPPAMQARRSVPQSLRCILYARTLPRSSSQTGKAIVLQSAAGKIIRRRGSAMAVPMSGEGPPSSLGIKFYTSALACRRVGRRRAGERRQSKGRGQNIEGRAQREERRGRELNHPQSRPCGAPGSLSSAETLVTHARTHCGNAMRLRNCARTAQRYYVPRNLATNGAGTVATISVLAGRSSPCSE
jgi:hypothetical protein